MDETEDEFSEIVDPTVPRVDLVSKSANGLPFLIAKSADGDGLVSAEEVRALIGETPVEKAADAETETVTVTGTPASIAHMIHQAAVRGDIRKADHTAPGQPTHTEEAVVAKATEQVTKADGDVADAPLEVSDIVSDAPAGGTAESVPGSPDWEQLDADTAASAIGVLGRVKAAIEWLATREATEAVTDGEAGDADNAFDLQDAACQIDCLIRRLGGFAAGEQLEADLPSEVEAVTKAVADATGLLGELEPFAAIEKAGRVLSSQNEQRVRNASGLLQEVLSTLPAPTETEVLKSEETAETQEVADVAKTAGTVAVAVAIDEASIEKAKTELAEVADAAAAAVEAVEKAKGDPQVAVYTADGKLVGVVDQADISPIAAPAAPEGGDEQSADTGSDDTDATDAPTEPATTAAAPVAETVPGTATVAAPAPTNDDSDDDAVQKSDSHAELATLLKETLAPITEKLSDYAELGDVVKGLQEQVEHLAAMPDDRKSPIMKGATGVPGIASRDGSDITDPFADLRKAAADESATPEQRLAAQNQLAYAAIRERIRPTHG